VPEFRIADDALKRELRFRMLSWGAVLLLIAVATILFILRVSGYISDSSGLGSLFVLTILGAAIVALILAPREGLHRAERQMVFVLEDHRIVRRRQGYPDVEIAFSEVESLREELRWLIITSAEGRKKIAIPRSVSGYELIRMELAKHHPLSAHVALPGKGAALLAVSILSWAGVIWFRDVREISAAAIIAVVTLAFGSYRFWALLHLKPKVLFLWASLGFAWLAALLLIYSRVHRP
jgi:hypothetical protein